MSNLLQKVFGINRNTAVAESEPTVKCTNPKTGTETLLEDNNHSKEILLKPWEVVKPYGRDSYYSYYLRLNEEGQVGRLRNFEGKVPSLMASCNKHIPQWVIELSRDEDALVLSSTDGEWVTFLAVSNNVVYTESGACKVEPKYEASVSDYASAASINFRLKEPGEKFSLDRPGIGSFYIIDRIVSAVNMVGVSVSITIPLTNRDGRALAKKHCRIWGIEDYTAQKPNEALVITFTPVSI